MKKTYFDAIRSGRKTTTLRYWRRAQVRRDSVHRIRGLGRVRIDDVTVVRREDLTDAHARADGFETLAALTDALEDMYPPKQRGERQLFLVQFTFLAEGARPADRREG